MAKIIMVYKIHSVVLILEAKNLIISRNVLTWNNSHDRKRFG